MTLMQKLERWLAPYAVQNPTLYWVMGQAFVYFGDFLGPQRGAFSERLMLVPGLVMQGEVWRLVTFPFVPPGMSPIWILIYLMALYFFGQTVESFWGSVRYNLYLATGIVATAAAAWLAPWDGCTALYLQTSIFLAYATLLPETHLNIYFVFPVKAKWLALLTWLMYGVAFYGSDWPHRGIIIAAVANYLLFFGKSAFVFVKDWRRRSEFKRKVLAGNAAAAALRHECRVCGITSDMAPKMAFRYCSQCAGSCCYCPEHLRAHEHVTEAGVKS
jgi:membrane associated rhomboid family serine protease